MVEIFPFTSRWLSLSLSPHSLSLPEIEKEKEGKREEKEETGMLVSIRFLSLCRVWYLHTKSCYMLFVPSFHTASIVPVSFSLSLFLPRPSFLTVLSLRLSFPFSDNFSLIFSHPLSLSSCLFFLHVTIHSSRHTHLHSLSNITYSTHKLHSGYIY